MTRITLSPINTDADATRLHRALQDISTLSRALASIGSLDINPVRDGVGPYGCIVVIHLEVHLNGEGTDEELQRALRIMSDCEFSATTEEIVA